MTFSSNKVNRTFQPGWALSLFFAVFFLLTVSLGVWQVNRAAWKTQLMNEYELRAYTVPVVPQKSSQVYSHVLIQGEPLTELGLWWDNRIYNGQPGYELLVPVQFGRGDYDIALVNLGWTKGSANRALLPEKPNLPRQVTWRGVLRPLDENWGSGDSTERGVIDYPVLSKIFNNQDNWLPYLVELDEAEPYALQLNWQPSVMPPEKHRAYAFQWFTMAVALVVMFIIVGRRSSRSDKNDDPKQ